MEDLEILDFAAARTPAKPLVFELQTTATDSPTNEENEESQVKDKDQDEVEDEVAASNDAREDEPPRPGAEKGNID